MNNELKWFAVSERTPSESDFLSNHIWVSFKNSIESKEVTSLADFNYTISRFTHWCPIPKQLPPPLPSKEVKTDEFKEWWNKLCELRGLSREYRLNHDQKVREGWDAALQWAKAQKQTIQSAADMSARISEYLQLGGLFNPESMEHDKVRDLLMDCRTAFDSMNHPITKQQEKPICECGHSLTMHARSLTSSRCGVGACQCKDFKRKQQPTQREVTDEDLERIARWHLNQLAIKDAVILDMCEEETECERLLAAYDKSDSYCKETVSMLIQKVLNQLAKITGELQEARADLSFCRETLAGTVALYRVALAELNCEPIPKIETPSRLENIKAVNKALYSTPKDTP